MNAALDDVLRHPAIWRGNEVAASGFDAFPTGYPALDAHLPGGGWPGGALTEILFERAGVGELHLLMPALARLSRKKKWLAWIAPPHVPYAPALATAGIQLDKLMLSRPRTAADAWWATEQAMRSGACSAVLAWLDAPDERRLRRLQLGAEKGKTWGVLLNPVQASPTRSPAALRLRLEPGENAVWVHILKRRGGALDKPVRIVLDDAGRPSAPEYALFATAEPHSIEPRPIKPRPTEPRPTEPRSLVSRQALVASRA